MEPITIYNIIYKEYLWLIQSCLILGKPIPDKLIESAKEAGEMAEVPKERLAIIDLIEREGKTIH